MKISSVLILGFFLVSLRAEEPDWKVNLSYGIGYADYSEDAEFFPVESEWSALATDLTFIVKKNQGKIYPYFRLRFMGTDQDKETWKKQDLLIQENDLTVKGVDFGLGLEIPHELQNATLTYSAGVVTRYQSHERKNFVLINGKLRFLGDKQTVTEDVYSTGVGGGLAYEYPVNETWLLGAESYVHWLFDIYANNDGFDTEIDGHGGVSWESGLWVERKLNKPGQSLGLMFSTDMQWIEGDSIENLPQKKFVEWPDNKWEYFRLAFFWRGEF